MIGPEQDRSAPSTLDSHGSRFIIPYLSRLPDAVFVMVLFYATAKALKNIRYNYEFMSRHFVKIIIFYPEGRMFGIEADIGLVIAAIMS